MKITVMIMTLMTITVMTMNEHLLTMGTQWRKGGCYSYNLCDDNELWTSVDDCEMTMTVMTMSGHLLMTDAVTGRGGVAQCPSCLPD